MIKAWFWYPVIPCLPCFLAQFCIVAHQGLQELQPLLGRVTSLPNRQSSKFYCGYSGCSTADHGKSDLGCCNCFHLLHWSMPLVTSLLTQNTVYRQSWILIVMEINFLLQVNKDYIESIQTDEVSTRWLAVEDVRWSREVSPLRSFFWSSTDVLRIEAAVSLCHCCWFQQLWNVHVPLMLPCLLQLLTLNDECGQSDVRRCCSK